MHFAFTQMRCAFGQLCKPNTNLNLTLTLKLSLTLTLILTLLQIRCAIDQILRDSSNVAQLINWSSARLVKRPIDQMRATWSLLGVDPIYG